jgi:hypothetical protein
MALQLQVRASPNAREEREEKEEQAAKVQAANQIFRLLDQTIRSLSSRFWTYFSADSIGIANRLRRRFPEYLDAIKRFVSVRQTNINRDGFKIMFGNGE